MEFERPVDAKGNIEVWLQRLVDGMQDTVKQIIKRAVRNVQEMGLEDFIFSNPAQISLLGIQFQWTADTQSALSNAKTDKTIMSKNMKKVGAAVWCEVVLEKPGSTVKLAPSGTYCPPAQPCVLPMTHSNCLPCLYHAGRRHPA